MQTTYLTSDDISYYILVISIISLISFTLFFTIHQIKKQRDFSEKFWKNDLSMIALSLLLTIILIPITFYVMFALGSTSTVNFISLPILLFPLGIALLTVSLFLKGLIDIIVRVSKKQ